MSDQERAGPVIENLDSATFTCVYPTCGGVCCRNGRPAIEPAEERTIGGVIDRLLDRLRPAARKRVERNGWLTARRKEGLPTLAVVDGWCVFFNDGCVLHRLGAEEADKWRYKPWRCILFPLGRDTDGTWHVRQHGYRHEAWDVFCLNPKESPQPAADSLREEMAFLERLVLEEKG